MTMPRVGFWGMGGIGKTVIGAAIVRNDDVRQHFHVIIWLPFGQTPVISKLQNLCHMQCTGKELSSELSSDENQEALQQAMKGKRVLLCLDDLWEEEHELELNFVDASTGSKVLISTRMKALLDGGHQVEVGLPSPSDSARMLLSAADADVSDRQPSGVSEIVDLCGRLPLALGIAGRLAASLGLVGTADWSGMIGVLKEELRESHSGGAEEGMIRASLRGLKGSAKEQANVRSLLLMFAFVPEDTFCPLEVMLLMFNAVYEGSGATMMHIRKWLRILVNRSLVLGTIDRPSVHDLVLEFTVAQHSADALRLNHRRIVEAFRAARPVDGHGRLKFDAMRMGESMVTYVRTEVKSHVELCWLNGSSQDEVEVIEWLTDVPQDAIVIATGEVIGLEKLAQLAGAAETAGNWWLSARYWSVAREVTFQQSGNGAASEAASKALYAISQMPADADDPAARDDIRFEQARTIITAFDVLALNKRLGEFHEILRTDAAVREPATTMLLSLFLAYAIPVSGDWTFEHIGDSYVEAMAFLRTATRTEPDAQQQIKCALMAISRPECVNAQLLSKAWDWDEAYGRDGHQFIATHRAYAYDHHHDFVMTANGDFLHTMPGFSPVLQHWGDVSFCEENTDQSLMVMRRCMDEPDQILEQIGLMLGLPTWGQYMHLTGLTYGRDKLAAYMVEYGLSWHSAHKTLDTCLTPWLRSRGDTTMNTYGYSVEYIAWLAQMAHVLVSANPGVSADEVLANLPSIDDIISACMTWDSLSLAHASVSHHMNLFIDVAAVCEKYEAYERALQYIDAALSPDIRRAGTRLPMCRAASHSLRGRVLASLGRAAEAGAAFETAAEESHRYGLRLYEAYALRDLKLCVLDHMGQVEGEHGSRRLGAALRLLKGPADKLTPLLKGLDAVEMMSLPSPDASYRVVYEAEDSATPALRQELSGLKLKALKSRARELGVTEEALEDADDEDDVKVAVTGLCIEAATASQGGGHEVAALRIELSQLKLKALKSRARETGVSADALDDADDADDIKQAVTDLIIAAMKQPTHGHAATTDKPHFGSAPTSAKPVHISTSVSTRHVMLSYQWDHQVQVTRVYDTLTRFGVNCWMDIRSGMGADIYEGMANAVSNASVVVCFMSQKYQASANCMLEVKFAKQSGMDMVAVMMEGSEWRPSGWLGLITAGSLWTRLSDESEFEDNVRQLHGQLQGVIGASPTPALDMADEGIATASEAKEELERLREDLVSKDNTSNAAVLADPSQPATIPAGVPKLPPKFQTTEQIEELTRLVLSASASDMAMSRVGFWGMGGIGKTVTGAAIVRNDDVRLHFHAIIWLPLGQSPVISKLQNLCHMQCTGKELSPELSSDEKQEALQQAMKGKRVLLCLDDLWEEEHELELNFVDVSAGSKVLISTRMKALLDGGHQMEVGLPSPSDSARMLLSAADADVSGRQPSGVSEIVDLCGRLPHALGIAGRLAASLGFVGTADWSGMIGVLKEELRESHSGGAEEGMIRASLRGLKGSVSTGAGQRAIIAAPVCIGAGGHLLSVGCDASDVQCRAH